VTAAGEARVRVLAAYCLAKPGTSDGYPFGPGALVVKVAGRMFALIADDLEPVRISLKCEPAIAELLRTSHGAVAPGYHLNKRHWITVTLDGSVDDEVTSWIDDSYDLVVDGLPRRERERLRPEG
jgi:predicted DNA-binding protein (MmcQ/YjbR family)